MIISKKNVCSLAQWDGIMIALKLNEYGCLDTSVYSIAFYFILILIKQDIAVEIFFQIVLIHLKAYFLLKINLSIIKLKSQH